MEVYRLFVDNFILIGARSTNNHFCYSYAYLIYLVRNMKNINCIIFDIDGTLTQTNELIFASFNYFSKKYLNEIYTPSQITAMFGPPEEVTIEKLVGFPKYEAALADFLDFYRKNHNALARLYPGIVEILEFLKMRGIIMAVFTGKGLKSTLITLEEFNIKQYFDLIVTGSDVKNHKPSAEGIRKIINYFGLKEENVLMVGDAVADVKAAHEAGIKIAAVVWDSYSKEKVLQMDVDFVFENVEEFRDFLKASLKSVPEGDGRSSKG